MGQVGVRVSPSPSRSRRRKPRPRWIFNTSLAVSKNEAAAHDVLEEVGECVRRVLRLCDKPRGKRARLLCRLGRLLFECTRETIGFRCGGTEGLGATYPLQQQQGVGRREQDGVGLTQEPRNRRLCRLFCSKKCSVQLGDQPARTLPCTRIASSGPLADVVCEAHGERTPGRLRSVQQATPTGPLSSSSHRRLSDIGLPSPCCHMSSCTIMHTKFRYYPLLCCSPFSLFAVLSAAKPMDALVMLCPPNRQQARQVEAFILNGGQRQKIITPRWRAMTGKRLLRLEHGQRVGLSAERSKKGRRPQQAGQDHGNGAAGATGGGKAGGQPLSGLEEEGSDTSSSSGSDDGR